MANQISSILRKFTRSDDEPLHILTAPTHEAYETNLAKTNAIFYAYEHEHFKTWNTKYRPLPPNYVLLRNSKRGQLPFDIDFDLVLSQNKFGQYQVLSDIAQKLNLPFVSLEHTLPIEQWGPQRRLALAQMQGHKNVFISDFSAKAWGYKDGYQVIHHGIDTDLFKYNPYFDVDNNILSVCNDWINRDHCCNFKGWQRITKGLPVKVIGDTPGLSKPANSVDELVEAYCSSAVFLNTSTVSPIPTALLEAMSCGCAVVSTATCMIPEIIQNGVNGFISNDENELRKYCEILLNDWKLRERMQIEARETIKNKFSQAMFVQNWNKLFREAALINP